MPGREMSFRVIFFANSYACVANARCYYHSRKKGLIFPFPYCSVHKNSKLSSVCEVILSSFDKTYRI